jgi:Arc/MetJ-type ribon-helix-helix transcriptional regulator
MEKTLTVRLPASLVAEIDAEARRRDLTRSDVVRERLESADVSAREGGAALHAIADLIGTADGLPADLARRHKAHLKATGYGRTRSR